MRRGLGAAQSEWSLAGMTYNLLKLWRSLTPRLLWPAFKGWLEASFPMAIPFSLCTFYPSIASTGQPHRRLEAGPR